MGKRSGESCPLILTFSPEGGEGTQAPSPQGERDRKGSIAAMAIAFPTRLGSLITTLNGQPTMVTIFTAFNPMDAQLIRSRLEAAGLHPEVTHELSALSIEGYAQSAGGILVKVPPEEADEAKALVAAKDP